MKTFKDLKFRPHLVWGQQARMNFSNGYGVSVLFGKEFYSNGKNTYEIAVTYNNNLCYDTYITDNVIGYKKCFQISKIMKKVQKLRKGEKFFKKLTKLF